MASNVFQFRTPTNDSRPEIQVTPDLHTMVVHAVSALARDESVFQRAGELVHVVTPLTGPTRAANSREPRRDAPLIRALPPSVRASRLAASARWVAQRKNEWVPCAVPRDVVSAVHALGEWGGIRAIVGVISAPTMRPDGTILQAPGFDAATGLLYWPSIRFPVVEDAPSAEDVREAADSILDLVCDYPFAAPSDRSAWLALVLTIVARHLVSHTVPFFAVDGNVRGCGKSTLVDLATLVAHGCEAARMPASDKDEELRKQITSQLLLGSPVVLVDNVRSGSAFGSPALDALMTSSVWTDRDLGRMRMLILPSRSVWVATGNNIGFAHDLSRRTLRIRLASPLQNPEHRSDFKHGNEDSLKRLTIKDRHALVTQCLTILRAYHAAGMPDEGAAPWGSFGEWSRKVGGAIRWLGLPDPMLSRATADADDDTEGQAVTAVCAALGHLVGTTGRHVSARELVDALWPVVGRHEDPRPDPSPTYAAARDALASRGRERPSVQQVAHWLRARRGTVVRGERIVSSLDTKANALAWGVEGA